VATVLTVAPGLRSVRRIRFVLWSPEDLKAFAEALERAS
jgi:hypothetical protein